MWKSTQRSWTAGELDTRLAGRQDLQSYFKGATTITNFLVHSQGWVAKRAGTFKKDFVTQALASPYFDNPSTIKPSELTTRIVPFVWETDQSQFLLFIATPTQTARVFLCDKDGVIAFDLTSPSEGTGWIKTSLTATQVKDFNFCQSGDTIFITESTISPMKIMRHPTNYTLTTETLKISYASLATPETPILLNNNANATTYSSTYNGEASGCPKYMLGQAGDGTWPVIKTFYYKATRYTEDQYESEPSDVGCIEKQIALKNKGKAYTTGVNVTLPWAGGGYVSVSVTYKDQDAEGTESFRIYKKATNGEYGLIGTILKSDFTVTEATEDTPAKLVGVFKDFNITPDTTLGLRKDTKTRFETAGKMPRACALYQQRLVFAGTDDDPARIWMSQTGDLYEFTPHISQREDDPIDVEIAATELPTINHLVFFRELLAFSEGGEWLISPVSGNAMTYKTISAKQQSAIGCAPSIPPIIVRDEVVFVSRDQKRLYATSYNYVSNGYESRDLTLLARHLFDERKIVSIAYATKYVPRIECVLDNGDIAVLSYDKTENVCAWTHFEIKNARGQKTVKQVINPGDDTLIYLANDGEKDCLLVQATDAPTPTSDYYASERPYQDYYANGTGVTFPAILETMRPEPMGDGSTIQFELKNAKDVEVRVSESGEFTIRAHGVPAEMAVDSGVRVATLGQGHFDAVTTDVRKVLNGHNQTDGRIVIRSTSDEPLNILSLSTNYEIQPLSGSEG